MNLRLNELKVAVVGTGYWGKNHVRIYSKLRQEGEIDDLTLCDVSLKRVKHLANEYHTAHTTDFEKILNDESIKAVSVATPTKTHYEIGKGLMEAGKDVLIEKPLTMVSEEAEELIEIAKKNNCILQVGHIFRYHPAVNAVKIGIDRGEFGNIFHIISNRLSFRTPRKDMGVLHALAVHEVDIFKYLLGEEPDRITCINRSNLKEGVEDTSFLTMEFPSGAVGHSLESWMFPIFEKKRELMVIGKERSAVVDYLQPDEIIVFKKSVSLNGKLKLKDEGSFKIRIQYKEPLKEEIKSFLGCVKERNNPIADGTVGLEAIRLVEKAFESSEKGKTIKIK